MDCLYHWLTAACVLVLLATGVLPNMGLRFAWLDLHWITGIGLTLLVIFHLVRSFVWIGRIGRLKRDSNL